MVDRRGLLLAASGTLLAGCGGAETARGPTPREAPHPDVDVLRRLLALEHRWAAVAPGHPRGHVKRLQALIRALGGTPDGPHAEYDSAHAGPLATGGAAVAAYVDALPRLRGSQARALAAEILTEEAAHLAAARATAGLDPAPRAFVQGRWDP